MRESSDHHLMEEKAWGCELDHTEPVKHPHLTLKALNSLKKNDEMLQETQASNQNFTEETP